MTVLVWDGKTLAADKQCTYGGLKLKIKKIFRVGEDLIGFTGNAEAVPEMLHWLDSGGELNDFPFRKEDNIELTTVLITPKKQILVFNGWSPIPLDLSENKFYADGCGMHLAYGALMAGKSAKEAVAIVCKMDTGCGMGIDTLTHKAPKKKKV